MFPLICVWINGWVNNREASDLRRYRSHHGVNVMFLNVRCSILPRILFCPDFPYLIITSNNSPRFCVLFCRAVDAGTWVNWYIEKLEYEEIAFLMWYMYLKSDRLQVRSCCVKPHWPMTDITGTTTAPHQACFFLNTRRSILHWLPISVSRNMTHVAV